jgi:ribose 5-phosphate isomerase A
MADLSELKRALGTQAVDRFVRDGMRVGLGTGSTAIWATRRLGARLAEGSLRGIRAVVTSIQTELEARSLGIPLFTLNDASLDCTLDLTVDGADEIDPSHNLIKGGGGALLREKIVASASRTLLIIADDSKLSSRLCEHFAIPLEIVADAVVAVSRRVREMGGEATLRVAVRKAGPVVTDLGNLLLDVTFRQAFDPRKMEDALKLIPGVLENGVFSKNRPELLIGDAKGNLDHRVLGA